MPKNEREPDLSTRPAASGVLSLHGLLAGDQSDPPDEVGLSQSCPMTGC